MTALWAILDTKTITTIHIRTPPTIAKKCTRADPASLPANVAEVYLDHQIGCERQAGHQKA